MKLNRDKILIPLIITLIVVGVAQFSCIQCDKDSTKPSPQIDDDSPWTYPLAPDGPWVILDQGEKLKYDGNALEIYVRKKYKEKTHVFYNEDAVALEFRLEYEYNPDDATPYSRLLEIAEEIRQKLPKGCPIKVTVETPQEAIKEENRCIKRCQDNIKSIEEIHINNE